MAPGASAASSAPSTDGRAGRRPSILDRLRRRYTAPIEQHEAEELRSRCQALGVVPIAEAQDREPVEVAGIVRSLTRPPVSSGPLQLTVELYDGSGALDVVWLGRREIPGISPGAQLRVHGRIGRRGAVRTMYNPRYEIGGP